jgi:mRNA-degrading endonuclease toxin of MazEF toxin-antitoxin module
VSLEQAEAYGRTAGGQRVWLVARPKTFQKYGRPAGFHEVLGEEQRPGRPLVLLRSDATKP